MFLADPPGDQPAHPKQNNSNVGGQAQAAAPPPVAELAADVLGVLFLISCFSFVF